MMAKTNIEQMLEKKETGKCPFCGKDMSNPIFRDEKSKKEYDISGICQECQDKY